MWAVSILTPSAPYLNRSSSLSLGGGGGTSKSPLPRRLVVFSLSDKSHRRLPPPQEERSTNQEEEVRDGLGRAVFNALKSNQQSTSNSKQPNQLQRRRQGSSGQRPHDEERQELRGSDVLLALERASAQKIKKKNKMKKERVGSPMVSQNGGASDDDDEYVGSLNCGSVRSLHIKRDWATRLDELEMRLHDLMNTSAT